ncbi:hypothetical protein [Paeniglutamicibacter sp.]|uniref:hypothetical protein n=1 Tax=Paeniglutamicibacter sp. TaxID=1934391 RepID=UPI00398A12C4
MSAINDSGQLKRTVRPRRASIIWFLAAAVLFLASAALQLAASLQRWVVFSGSRSPEDTSVEDHLYDYSFPFDPWESIGTAAQFFGVGVLILALGVLAMAFGVLGLPGAAGSRSVIEIVLAILVAASFIMHGTHALVSGVTGAPSELQNTMWLIRTQLLVGLASLIALASLWASRLRAAMAACLFLLGSTIVGEIVANFMIAPMIAGGTSHDTTRWSETVIAASTAAAAVSMLYAIKTVTRRGASSA